MGRNGKIIFGLKPVLSCFEDCFFFFFKREQLFLDLSIIIKERKTAQTGQKG